MFLHSLCFMIVGGMLVACGQYFEHPMMDRGQLVGSIARSFSLYALAFLVLSPALMLDSFRLSNRIVGPICRLRNAIQGIARDEQIAPLQFRSGDFWQDIPEQFNVMIDKLREGQASEADAEEFAVTP